MSSKREPQRKIHRVTDADPRSDHYLRFGKAVIARLERRSGAGDVKAIMSAACQAQRQAQAAWARGDHPRRSIFIQPAVSRHLCDADHRLQGAQQDAAGQAFLLASDVHAVIHSVDRVHIGMAGRSEEHKVARRGSAMRMCRRVRRVVVRAKVGLDLDNASGQWLAGLRIDGDQNLAQKLWSDFFRRIFKEFARNQPPGKLVFAQNALISVGLRCYLWLFFHSFSSASTSSAWPSGVTLGKI